MSEDPISTLPACAARPFESATAPALPIHASRYGCDIGWSFYSPDLLDEKLAGYENFSMSMRGNPGAVPAGIAHCSDEDRQNITGIPLGIYFEQLLAAGFSAVTNATQTLLLRNFQIKCNGKTQGELDFVLAQSDRQLIHLEVAVKFYLRPKNVDNPAHWRNWIGPNAADRLDKKLSRMAEHQLPIAGKNKAALFAHIEKTFGYKPVQLSSMYLLKGVYFYHWLEQPALPQSAFANALTGHWLYLSEFIELLHADKSDWLWLSKLEWLSLCLLDKVQHRATNSRTLIRLLSKNETGSPRIPAMFLQLKTGWREHVGRFHPAACVQNRVMVVNDYWPETSSPSRKR